MNKTTNPYQTGVANDFSLDQKNPLAQMDQYKREEDQAKAPLVMPYPLDTVLVPLIGEIFISLTNARNSLTFAKKNPAANKEGIKEIIGKIDDINKAVLDLQKKLSKITL